jgi:hypothetical protein
MSEYKGKGKGKGEGIKIDTVLDEFNRLTLGESRGRPPRGRPSRARGSHDSFSDEDESMEENPRTKKKNKVVLKKE